MKKMLMFPLILLLMLSFSNFASADDLTGTLSRKKLKILNS